MTKCCIKWCSARKNRNRPQLTLHKLPSNEAMKNKWLDIIGKENINPSIKRLFVCSLHFEETCFNRTLDVIRLRDGAMPSSSLVLKGSTPAQVAAIQSPDARIRVLNPVQDTILKSQPSLAKDTDLNQDDMAKTQPLPSTSFAKDTALNQDDMVKTQPLPSTSFPEDTALDQDDMVKTQPLPSTSFAKNTALKQDDMVKTQPFPSTSFAKNTALNQDDMVKTQPLPSTSFAKNKALSQDDMVKTQPFPSTSFAKDTAHNQDDMVKTQPLPSTSSIQNQSAKIQTKLYVLKKKCTEQRKIIKRLNEKVRRRDKKVAILTDIIQELEKAKLVNNEEAILLEECAGPEDFLKRQIKVFKV